MNKSQELKEKMNSLKSVQEDYFIDLEKDRAIIEEIYGPIFSNTTEESLAFLDEVIAQRKAKNE